MTAADDARFFNRRTDPFLVRPADTIAIVDDDLSVLTLPAEFDRHCPECGYMEPHHGAFCPWKEL